MSRVRIAFLGVTAIIVACNALTGAGDLAVCTGEECASSSVDGGAPVSPDAPIAPPVEEAGATCTVAPRCDGNTRVGCVGSVETRTACAEACIDGACMPWLSCRGTTSQCGLTRTSCCETMPVPGGTFRRWNTNGNSATVSAFALDRYEVTVGRFRAFVADGGGTKAKPPATGAGTHPKIADSGWKDAWNELLPESTTKLLEDVRGGTWTDAAGANESRPIGNVTWFEAFAFCAWDGARLPTFAEWSFAASGGDEQREYPWSAPPSDTTIDGKHATYGCLNAAPGYTCPASTCSDSLFPGPCDPAICGVDGGTCSTPACYGCDLLPDTVDVGTLPAGMGRWGHFDLAGNFSEILLDARSNRANVDYPSPCNDCAQLMAAQVRKTGGGPSFEFEIYVANGDWSDGKELLSNAHWGRTRYSTRQTGLGFRCARDL